MAVEFGFFEGESEFDGECDGFGANVVDVVPSARVDGDAITDELNGWPPGSVLDVLVPEGDESRPGLPDREMSHVHQYT